MKKTILLFILITGTHKLSAQSLAVNTDGSTANTSSILDVKSTSKGILIPRVALTGTLSSGPIGGTPPASLLIYNTASTAGADAVSPGYYYWTGTQWQRLFSDKDAWSITGNTGTSPSTDFLGTKDAQDLRILTNNYPSLYVKQATNFIGIGEEDPGDNFVIRLNTRAINPTPYNYSGIQLKPTFASGNSNNTGFHIGLETTLQKDARLMNFTAGGDLSMGIEGNEVIRLKNNTRYVGINEPNPQDNLVIRVNPAAINPSPNSNYSGIIISSAALTGTGNNRGFHIGLEDGFSGTSAHIMNQEASDLVLGTNAIEMMRFKAISRLTGLNTNNPLYALSVATVSNPNNVPYDGLQIISPFNNSSPSSGLVIGHSNIGQWQDKAIWNYDNGSLNFATNNLQRMTVTSNGVVGIGTTPGFSSTNALEVGGDMRVLGLANVNAFRMVTGSFTGAVLTCTDFIGNTGWTDPVIYTQWLVNGQNIYNKNTGNVGIGTMTPFAKLQVEDGSVLFYSSGAANPNPFLIPPVEGAGTRMMWFRERAAFRAGFVDTYKWDRDSIGNYSLATGYNTKASGNYAVALGVNNNAEGESSFSTGAQNTASGNYSTAMGLNSVASGLYATAIGNQNSALANYATAIGYNNTADGLLSTAIGYGSYAHANYSVSLGVISSAIGNYSIALGHQTSASGIGATSMGDNTFANGDYSTSMNNNSYAMGNYSTAMGFHTYAKALGSLTIGVYNDNNDNPAGAAENSTDRIFQIGNGTSSSASNALTVLRNGNIAVGFTLPQEKLHVLGNIRSSNLAGAGTRLATADPNGTLTFLANGLNGQVLTMSAGNLSWQNASSGWGLTGNTGTSAATNFIGTTDGIDLVIKTTNTERMRINATGSVGIANNNPRFPLSFSTATGDKISLWDDGNVSGYNYGIGIQSGVMQLHTYTVSDDVVFGYGSSTALTETVRFKGNGRVGIGTNNPANRLDITGIDAWDVSSTEGDVRIGNSSYRIKFGVALTGGGAGAATIMQYGQTGGYNALQLGSQGNTSVYIMGTGNVGIGTNNPSQKLHVIGNILASGTITPSDIRYKKNIQLISSPLEKLEQIRGVTYQYNAAAFPGMGFTDDKQIGFIAQEVEKVFPELVVTDKNGYKAVDYPKITPILLEAIKAQQKQIDELKVKIDLLLGK